MFERLKRLFPRKLNAPASANEGQTASERTETATLPEPSPVMPTEVKRKRGGGWNKKYASSAERLRAWKARKKAAAARESLSNVPPDSALPEIMPMVDSWRSELAGLAEPAQPLKAAPVPMIPPVKPPTSLTPAAPAWRPDPAAEASETLPPRSPEHIRRLIELGETEEARRIRIWNDKIRYGNMRGKSPLDGV